MKHCNFTRNIALSNTLSNTLSKQHNRTGVGEEMNFRASMIQKTWRARRASRLASALCDEAIQLNGNELMRFIEVNMLKLLSLPRVARMKQQISDDAAQKSDSYKITELHAAVASLLFHTHDLYHRGGDGGLGIYFRGQTNVGFAARVADLLRSLSCHAYAFKVVEQDEAVYNFGDACSVDSYWRQSCCGLHVDEGHFSDCYDRAGKIVSESIVGAMLVLRSASDKFVERSHTNRQLISHPKKDYAIETCLYPTRDAIIIGRCAKQNLCTHGWMVVDPNIPFRQPILKQCPKNEEVIKIREREEDYDKWLSHLADKSVFRRLRS